MKRTLFAIAIVTLMSSSAAAQLDGEVQGYVETRWHGLFGHSADLKLLGDLGLVDFDAVGFHPEDQWGAINRIRPTAKLHFGDLASLVVTGLAETRHGFFERRIESIPDVVSLERMYLSITKEIFDITIGKQLLAWGSGLVLNPTDLFNARAPDDLNAERPGVWAAKMLIGITDLSNFTVAAALDEDDCCQPVLLARYDHTIDATDLAVTFGWDARRDFMMVGLDLKTEFEIGAWLEMTWTQPLSASGGDGYLNIELGIDYTFSVLEQLYIALEWIHQGNGVGDEWTGAGDDPPPDYVTSTLLSGDTVRSPVLGTNYLATIMRLGIIAELRLQLVHMLNIMDPGGLAVLQLTWLATGGLELTLGGQVSYGARGGEHNLRVPSNPPIPDELQGDRINPVGSVYLWARVFY